MLSISSIRPLNRWDHSSIRPGPVASVGDVLQSVRLKASLPGDFHWDASTYGNNESLHGSNVQNGQYRSFSNGGGPARTRDSNWPLNRSFKTVHSWIHEDLRAPDRRIEPVMGAQPQYSWRNKIATVDNSLHTGELFRRNGPGIIPPTGPLRGGMFPRITDVVQGDPLDAPIDAGPDLAEPNFHPGSSFTSNSKTINRSSNPSSHMRERNQMMRGAPGRVRR